MWNYLLGGQDNFAANREIGELILKMFPGIAQIARVQRRFLASGVRYLAGEAGIGQFLDIGTGLPTASNTHQVAQQIAPQSRIVYVDNDRCKSGCTHALWAGQASPTGSDVRHAGLAPLCPHDLKHSGVAFLEGRGVASDAASRHWP